MSNDLHRDYHKASPQERNEMRREWLRMQGDSIDNVDKSKDFYNQNKQVTEHHSTDIHYRNIGGMKPITD